MTTWLGKFIKFLNFIFKFKFIVFEHLKFKFSTFENPKLKFIVFENSKFKFKFIVFKASKSIILISVFTVQFLFNFWKGFILQNWCIKKYFPQKVSKK